VPVASQSAILDIRDIAFSYDRSREFIKGLSLALAQGDCVALLGANASGKSTLLKLASGILKPSSGTITLWNRPLASYILRDRAKLISYLPQITDVHVPFKVKDVVSMGAYPYDIPPSMTVEEALHTVGLHEKADALITELSGGEKRRALIAMTLVQGAGILLLDEPLANLDIKYQIDLIRLLARLREAKRISIIMALHDIGIARDFGTVILLKDGKILAMGNPTAVITPSTIREAFDVDIDVSRLWAHERFLCRG